MDGASGSGGGLIIVLVAAPWLRVKSLAERNNGLGFGALDKRIKVEGQVAGCTEPGFGVWGTGLGMRNHGLGLKRWLDRAKCSGFRVWVAEMWFKEGC